MTVLSPPDLLTLQAVRLLGLTDTTTAAGFYGLDPQRAAQVLRAAADAGLVQYFAFAGLEGWSLTDQGRTENERQLAEERVLADPGDVIGSTYPDFLPLNARLVRACADWQIRPTDADALAPNDHRDDGWDQRILDELTALRDALGPIVERLAGVLARFNGYDTRFAVALQHARAGEHDWVDRTDVDSCHRVWFQLHEDLVATLGIDRATGG